jgi:hypothetical protein
VSIQTASLLVLLLPSLATVGPSAPTAPQSTEVLRVEPGRFSFEYPASFANHTATSQAIVAKQRADWKAKGETHPECADVVLSADRVTDAAQSSITVIKLDMACTAKQPTDDFLNNFMVKSAATMKKEPADQFTGPRFYMLSVHRAILTRGTVNPQNGRPSSVLLSCVVAEGDVYVWTIRSGNDAEVEHLAASLVKFDGQAAAPLVPPPFLLEKP